MRRPATSSSRPHPIARIALVACLLLALIGATAGPAAAAPGKGESKAKPTRLDLDGDGRPNARDRDVDGDGRMNGSDRDVDGDRRMNGRDLNVDGDRNRNAADRDVDGDFRRNVADSDLDGDRLANDYDHDIDGDRTLNAFDADSDASGDPLIETAAATQAPADFVGLVSDDAFWGTNSDPGRSKTMAGIAATGAKTLRQGFFWSIIEPRPGEYDFWLHDGYMVAAAQANLRVLPILFDPPGFRSSRPASGAKRGTYPPASNAEFATFAAALVARYGPNGEFWRQHPELPQLPIRAWQVWNEPNIPQYWPGGPNPAAYAAMLRTVSHGIKAADPEARVITAGINESELGIKLVPFLRGMYRAGAKGSFDTLAIHPYAPASDLVSAQITRAVRQLRRAGDDARTLVTELGWATGGDSKRALVVGEAGQAALIRRTLTQLAKNRDRLRLDGVYYFNWRDVTAEAGSSDHWGLHTGLLREDGSAKPAMQALTNTTRAVTVG